MNRHLRPRNLASFGLLLTLLVGVDAAPAAILRVPLDLPDLPTALAVSQDGDTVAVAASFVVAGGVVVPGRAITVSGGWDDGFLVADGFTTVLGDPASPAVSFAPPVSGSPIFEGFRIEGGGGAARVLPVAGRYGGGVLVDGGAPVLRRLEIVEGAVGDAAVLGLGGGVALLGTTATVQDVTVTGCRAAWGAGIFVDAGSPRLVRVAVIDNQAIAAPGGEVALGAGICVRRSNAVLEDCDVRGGRGAVRGGGIAWLGTRNRTLTLDRCRVEDNTFVQDGGGLWGKAGAVVITGGRFTGNVPAPDAPYTSGGGLYLTGAGVLLDGVELRDNRADAGGGATINAAAEAIVRDGVFAGNQASFFGAALNYQSNTAGSISGNTLAGNINLDPAGGSLQIVACSPAVTRNLVAFNQGAGIVVAGGAPATACNNVIGHTGPGWSGIADPTGQDGNLALDPLFCDLAAGDLSLDAASPCLDAPGCGLIGALGIGCGSATAAPQATAGATPALLATAFPNPANPAVTVRLSLAGAGGLRLTLHDLRGRLVRTLLDEPRPAGTLDVRWDGRDDAGRAVSSGVYRYLAVGPGGATATGTVTLLR